MRAGTMGGGERARRGVLAGVLVLLAGALPATASAGSCPNEEVRAEQGAGRLPDCRAFELVTPEIKADNGNFEGGTPYGFADGKHVFYGTELPMPGAGNGGPTNVLSTRTASGWVNTSLAPPATGPGSPNSLFPSPLGGSNGAWQLAAAFTGDFSQAFVDSGFDTDPLDQDYVPSPTPQVDSGTADAYRLDVASGAWSLASLPDTGPMLASFNSPGSGRGSYIAGVSEDGSHVFFQTLDQLPVAPGTPSEPHPGDMAYDRTGGHTYMVGVLPDGTVPQTCSVVGLGDGGEDGVVQGKLAYGAISPDGSNVVFKVRNANGEPCGPSEGVYLRENNATTIKLAGDGYVARSTDGSKIFTEGARGGVYEYDVASGATSTITTEGAFVASSADGSRVYYLNSAGPEPGLYLWDNGASILIPNAGEGFASDPVSSGALVTGKRHAVATLDGSKLLFADRTSLTGYDNFGPKCTDAGTQPGSCTEAYVYDAATGALTCVSCNPTGAPPLGGADLMGSSQNTYIPTYSEGLISPDGSRVFFETPDALVPQDTNGLSDVYEWENGRVYLISSGQGTSGSNLSGASSSGDDVFFTTTDRLAPQDIESSAQIYDARVGGGFAYRPFVPGCDSGQCQGPQTPAPVFGAPASATFVGAGNPAPAPALKPRPKPKAKQCKRGFVRKKHRCVKRKPSKTATRAGGDRGVKSHV